MVKYIFLDIDGVLYTTNYYAWLCGKGKRFRDADGWLWDPSTVTNLNHITDLTGAQIIISSTWRTAGLAHLQLVFAQRGVTGKLIGCTPYGQGHNCRGEEIQAWLDENGMPAAFVIIDDSNIGDYFGRAFVQTQMKTGLDAAATEKVLAKLNI